MMLTEASIKQLERMITSLANRHSTWEVFTDFVAMSALAISNGVDGYHYQEREQEYLQIIGKYSKDDQMLFPEMLAHLVEALEQCAQERHFDDILGRVFHDLELHNKYKGQFFTPMPVCNVMGRISVGDDGGWQERLQEKGYIPICEPACGSGAMIFGAANAYLETGLNWSKQMFVAANDIDLKCVHMAYVQLSLYGIPAVVAHANTLTRETWSYWYTPVYMLDGWFWREIGGLTTQSRADIEAFRAASQPMYRAYLAVRDLVSVSPKAQAEDGAQATTGEQACIDVHQEEVEKAKDSEEKTEQAALAQEFKIEESGQLALF